MRSHLCIGLLVDKSSRKTGTAESRSVEFKNTCTGRINNFLKRIKRDVLKALNATR